MEQKRGRRKISSRPSRQDRLAAPVPDEESPKKAGDDRRALSDRHAAPETPRVPEPGVFPFKSFPLLPEGLFYALVKDLLKLFPERVQARGLRAGFGRGRSVRIRAAGPLPAAALIRKLTRGSERLLQGRP